MISYAQNFEDVMLSRAFRGVTNGFYVDAGAWDPVTDSVTKHFYDLGWSGVNIEPHPLYYDRLVAERPRDRNIQCALGESNESRTFYLYEAGGTSTLRPEWSTLFTDRIPMNEVTVQMRRLADLLDDVPQEIHFFKIDTEGWELAVLKGCEWEKFRPHIVVIESIHPSTHEGIEQEWEPFLLAQGYDFAYFDGLNRFYIAHEHSQLRQHFAAPPNVFDEFTLFRELVLQNMSVILTTSRQELDEMGRRLSDRLSIPWQPPSDDVLLTVRELQRLVTEAVTRICSMQSEIQDLEGDARAARLWAARVTEQRLVEEIGRTVR
jgi:FkbM family methyltransferase